MTRQPNAQEGIPRGHRKKAQMMMLALEETSVLLLVPASSQDMRVESQLQLDICSQDIFLPMTETM